MTWAPAFAGATRMGIFIQLGGPKAHENSVESHVIPAQAGIQFLADMDPRLRGGDGLTCVSVGGPKAHENSVESHVIPAQAGIHMTWAPAFAGATRMGIFIQLGGPQAHENSVESHVIPAQAGIQFLVDMDPRLRGGDEDGDFHPIGWAEGP